MISTILMIMVVMVGMSVLFAFVAFYSQNYQAGLGSSVLESITIEDVWLKPSSPGSSSYGSEATVWLFNSGKVDSNVTAVYINGLAAAINLDVSVPIGGHVPVTVQAGSSWQSGNRYEFQVNTLRGSNFMEVVYAP